MSVALLPGQADNEALSTTNEVLFTTTKSASVTTPETYVIQNRDASIVVSVGDAEVSSTASGIAIAAGATLTLTFVSPDITIYAIAASGTPSVSVLRTS